MPGQDMLLIQTQQKVPLTVNKKDLGGALLRLVGIGSFDCTDYGIRVYRHIFQPEKIRFSLVNLASKHTHVEVVHS